LGENHEGNEENEGEIACFTDFLLLLRCFVVLLFEGRAAIDRLRSTEGYERLTALRFSGRVCSAFLHDYGQSKDEAD
jgi:hypothetical protein